MVNLTFHRYLGILVFMCMGFLLGSGFASQQEVLALGSIDTIRIVLAKPLLISLGLAL